MCRSIVILISFLSTTAIFANQGYLGISVRTDHAGDHKGLRLVNIYDDGAAWVAGLLENDLITGINGKPVANSGDLYRVLAGFQWGDMVKIEYIRDNASFAKEVVLGYDTRIRTYHILKSEQIGGEVIWYFSDNTTIVTADGEALSITKKFPDGGKETLDLAGYVTDAELPQRFRDLQDKLDIIQRTTEEQEGFSADADQITFVKESKTEGSADMRVIGEVRANEFNIFPNPSNGQFDVVLKSEDKGSLTWDIYDARGTSVDSGRLGEFSGNFTHHFNLSSKFKGTYLLYIRIGENRIGKQIVLQ